RCPFLVCQEGPVDLGGGVDPELLAEGVNALQCLRLLASLPLLPGGVVGLAADGVGVPLVLRDDAPGAAFSGVVRSASGDDVPYPVEVQPELGERAFQAFPAVVDDFPAVA